MSSRPAWTRVSKNIMLLNALMWHCGGWCIWLSTCRHFQYHCLSSFFCNRWPWVLAPCSCMFQLPWLPHTNQAPWLCSVVPFGSWMNSEEFQNNSEEHFLGLKLPWEFISKHKNFGGWPLHVTWFPNWWSLSRLFWDGHWIKNVTKVCLHQRVPLKSVAEMSVCHLLLLNRQPDFS